MAGSFDMRPIGRVESTRDEAIDDDWDAVSTAIVLDGSQVGPDAVAGLDEFSHIEVVYVFDRVDPAGVQTGARRPRGNPEWPLVGILAQRAKNRPNRIGVTRCELAGVDGLRLRVRGLDAIDGTPVLDIKPYLEEFGPRGPVRQPEWSRELMRGYW
ncbi:SAM-dependent methyltransferase [Rugosimonospora africana]|uniref:tRNA (N6-threonylcarbamoyladenosine(37)-N6)-methyltransferase TrmO n=1 Tax=Rugosimonospora africana TaxID=556532 RepID=A0A8J3QNZ1_9ACTN|nr:SAM-dependent methyltransferase [Rugosimonospora africana]GIH12893.1 tRNA (N6-threonylcarbamoyladenosine(37)-N6)-methyltransferase TrmO [Rugosimonospora africana]